MGVEVNNSMGEVLEITDQILNELADQNLISLDVMRWLEEMTDRKNESIKVINELLSEIRSISSSKGLTEA